jgi:hypothetical protein
MTRESWHQNMRALLAGLALLLLGGAADASCVCECVDGHMQPICQSAIDLPPLCPLTLCPLAPLAIAPLPPLTLPPLGTSQCRQARVCDRFGNCRWQPVCE